MTNEPTTASGAELAPGPDGTRSLANDYWTRYSGTTSAIPVQPFSNTPPSLESSSGFSTPTELQSAHREKPVRPTKLSVYDVHDQLEVLLQPLMTYVVVTSPGSDRYLHSLLDRLIQTESHLFPNRPERTTVTDAQQSLLVGIDATRTLMRYCEADMYRKGPRPRVGEVAEAIESLGDLCFSIGLGEEVRQGCLSLASIVRAS